MVKNTFFSFILSTLFHLLIRHDSRASDFRRNEVIFPCPKNQVLGRDLGYSWKCFYQEEDNYG
jgi:hypothetical protein